MERNGFYCHKEWSIRKVTGRGYGKSKKKKKSCSERENKLENCVQLKKEDNKIHTEGQKIIPAQKNGIRKHRKKSQAKNTPPPSLPYWSISNLCLFPVFYTRICLNCFAGVLRSWDQTLSVTKTNKAF